MQFLHENSILHRDIKPENFVLGTSEQQNKIFMIDFGMAKKFISKAGVHITYSENNELIGTPRYASLHAHQGHEQSR